MAPRPRTRSQYDVLNQSTLEEAMKSCHMEVWKILKDHIEMTEELKLDQLYNMIVHQVYRWQDSYQEESYKEFKELLSSLPVELISLISRGDPPVTSTLLQARYTYKGETNGQ